MTKPRIVFVGASNRAHIIALEAAGYEVTAVDSVREALRHRPRPDGVIVELIVPKNFDAFRRKPTGAQTRAMTIIGLAAENHRDLILQAGGTFCPNPCPPEELLEVTKRAIPLPAA